jgi:N-acetylated-alpha-linked acidic dipeptidase
VAPGDPTTIGYPSKPGCERGPANITTPSIPSIPISYEDALPLLKALNGYGPKAKSLGDRWDRGGLHKKGVKYNIGPSPDNVALHLVNEQEYVTTPFWNVIGVINGTIQDEVVVLGNHRDAWIAGGAGDPNSGSAALNEVVRSIGAALAKGWKPLRTIVFASWDGEEYGLVGSTEWVEEYLPWLDKATVAYLNIDVASTGPNFRTSAAPLLHRALIETTKLVLSPNQTKLGQTIYDVWNKHIATIGSGSDYTAFQDFAGIASVDMGFTPGPDTPVYHYHSNYDSFHWMETYGDPGFKYHATSARLWALLTARIVETPVLQFNATDYAIALSAYLEQVKAKAVNASMFNDISELTSQKPFKALESALHSLHNASNHFDATASSLLTEITKHPLPWWRWWERIRLYWRVKRVNEKYKQLERSFLYDKGLDGRSWFKHVVFAPGLWTGYAGSVFPGLVEAVDEGDREGLWRWAGIITGCVEKATNVLSK